jgi:hypothetical protein
LHFSGKSSDLQLGVVNCNVEDFLVWFSVHFLSQSNHFILCNWHSFRSFSRSFSLPSHCLQLVTKIATKVFMKDFSSTSFHCPKKICE